MTDNFPLFKLPYVALYKVLDHVGTKVTIPISLCSRRIRLIVKNYHGPSKRVNIEFDIDQCTLKVDHTTLISVMSVPKYQEYLERVTIGPRRVPVYIRNGILETYWNDEKEGMTTIIEFTLDVFNAKLHSLKSYLTSSADVRFWIEWIRKFQGKIHTLFARLSAGQQEELTKYILESDFVTGDLELPSLYTPNGRRLVPDPRSYPVNFFYLRSSYWVTLDNFLAMDIKKICLKYTHLTCQDVNIFLKRWIKGECSKRIKEVSLDIFKDIEIDVLFMGIEVTRRDPNSIRHYVGYKGTEPIVGGFDIRRKTDDAMATIMVKYGGLKILFWPDNEGYPYH